MSYRRINKRVAKRLFTEGVTVRVLPCKANPHSPWWHGGACWNPAYIKENTSKDFDEMVSAFIYYNCNHEVGYYPAFYVED